MDDIQQKFFKHIAAIQESCVEICLTEHKKYYDNEIRSMLYDVTYEFAVKIMEIDIFLGDNNYYGKEEKRCERIFKLCKGH